LIPQIQINIIAAMRRAFFFPATSAILFTLLMAPFFHIHESSKIGFTHEETECPIAVVHAHFSDGPETPAGEHGHRNDVDHSTKKVKSFVLSSLQSTSSTLEIQNCEAVAPDFMLPLNITFESTIHTDVLSIHDPPGLLGPTLRAPPHQ
jgi:hypothetical protein